MEHVRETTQQLNIRFATQRASVTEKTKSNSYKRLGKHLSTVLCGNAKYILQIIEKWQGKVELVVVLSILVKQFLGGREKQNRYLS